MRRTNPKTTAPSELPLTLRLALLSSWLLLVALSWLATPPANAAGTETVPLRTVAARLGMETRQSDEETVLLRSPWTRIRFTLHKRDILLNDHRVFLGFPVAEKSGKLHLAEADYTGLLQPLLTPQVFPPDQPIRHIVLDPGHGGKDTGARNTELGLIEKSLVMDLAKRLRRQLREEGFTVTLTRNSDTFIPLAERSRIANRAQADLFLSLHFNASRKTDVHGIETFSLTPVHQPSTGRLQLHPSDHKKRPGNRFDPYNSLLGFYVQRGMVQKIKTPDRGLKRARFAVLRNLRMPGILIEGGFISHDTEGRNVGSAAYRERIAAAIVEGVQTYQRTQRRLRQKQKNP